MCAEIRLVRYKDLCAADLRYEGFSASGKGQGDGTPFSMVNKESTVHLWVAASMQE